MNKNKFMVLRLKNLKLYYSYPSIQYFKSCFTSFNNNIKIISSSYVNNYYSSILSRTYSCFEIYIFQKVYSYDLNNEFHFVQFMSKLVFDFIYLENFKFIQVTMNKLLIKILLE